MPPTTDSWRLPYFFLLNRTASRTMSHRLQSVLALVAASGGEVPHFRNEDERLVHLHHAKSLSRRNGRREVQRAGVMRRRKSLFPKKNFPTRGNDQIRRKVDPLQHRTMAMMKPRLMVHLPNPLDQSPVATPTLRIKVLLQCLQHLPWQYHTPSLERLREQLLASRRLFRPPTTANAAGRGIRRSYRLRHHHALPR